MDKKKSALILDGRISILTAAGLNGPVNGARWRACCSPSRLSMLGPITCAVEKRGSSTVNVSWSHFGTLRTTSWGLGLRSTLSLGVAF